MSMASTVTVQTCRQRSDSGHFLMPHPTNVRSRTERVPRGLPSSHRRRNDVRPNDSTLMLRRIIASEDSGAARLRLPRREVVYGCYGADGDSSIYLVEKGYVKVVTPSRDGKECLLGIFTAGDIVGELCFSPADRCESLTTMTPAVLWRIPKLRLMELLDNAGVREEFVGYLAHRLLEQQQLITHFVTVDSERRLAAVLLHLARKMGWRDGSLLVINARITQEEFAAMVGTTRSRVGVFLSRFIKSGAVYRGPGGVLGVHESRLEALFAG